MKARTRVLVILMQHTQTTFVECCAASTALVCTLMRVYLLPIDICVRCICTICAMLYSPIDEAEALHSSFRLPHCALLVRDELRRRT